MIFLLNRNKKWDDTSPERIPRLRIASALCLPETEDFYFHENVRFESFVFYGGKHENDPVL